MSMALSETLGIESYVYFLLNLMQNVLFTVQCSRGRIETREPSFKGERSVREKDNQDSHQSRFSPHRNSAF
jgi:hypothetical protein